MQFDLILTSDIVGKYKPHASMYQSALRAVGHEKDPGSVAMVAAHVYDLEAAAKWWAVKHRYLKNILLTHPRSGFKTIYIKRSTEDMDVKIDHHAFDLVINEGGLVELARRLGLDM